MRVLGLALTIILTSCARESLLTKAESAFSSGQFKEAIELYDLHREERANTKGRPEWENPAFYHLIVVDSLLKLNNPGEAEKRINLGIKEKVETSLIVEKVRLIALWYLENEDLSKAIDFLDRYHHLDPEYIDGIIDGISKRAQ